MGGRLRAAEAASLHANFSPPSHLSAAGGGQAEESSWARGRWRRKNMHAWQRNKGKGQGRGKGGAFVVTCGGTAFEVDVSSQFWAMTGAYARGCLGHTKPGALAELYSHEEISAASGAYWVEEISLCPMCALASGLGCEPDHRVNQWVGRQHLARPRFASMAQPRVVSQAPGGHFGAAPRASSPASSTQAPSSAAGGSSSSPSGPTPATWASSMADSAQQQAPAGGLFGGGGGWCPRASTQAPSSARPDGLESAQLGALGVVEEPMPHAQARPVPKAQAQANAPPCSVVWPAATVAAWPAANAARGPAAAQPKFANAVGSSSSSSGPAPATWPSSVADSTQQQAPAGGLFGGGGGWCPHAPAPALAQLLKHAALEQMTLAAVTAISTMSSKIQNLEEIVQGLKGKKGTMVGKAKDTKGWWSDKAKQTVTMMVFDGNEFAAHGDNKGGANSGPEAYLVYQPWNDWGLTPIYDSDDDGEESAGRPAREHREEFQ